MLRMSPRLGGGPGRNASMWRRSSRCSTQSCVEVEHLGDTVRVRDSKLADSPVLTYSQPEWADFLAGVKAGEFDGEVSA